MQTCMAPRGKDGGLYGGQGLRLLKTAIEEHPELKGHVTIRQAATGIAAGVEGVELVEE